MKRLRYWWHGRQIQKAGRILAKYNAFLCDRCKFFKSNRHRPCFAVGCTCPCSK